jgi:class 3 adenylate cyclase
VDVPDVRYTRSGEIALAYQAFGDGPLELVYAPQWINNLELAWTNPLYARFLRRLGSLGRIAFFDRRGTGLSDRLAATDAPPLETLMEDLGAVVDAAGFERPVLFGGSDAASVCALFAATHPDRTSALIAYGAEARGTAAPDYPWAWSAEAWHEYLTELASGWGTDAYTKRVFDWLVPSERADAEQRVWWRAMMRLSATPSSMSALEAIWAKLDIRPVLPTVQAPTLVLHRSGDPVEEVEAGRDFAVRIPGARFVELPGDDWPVWAGDQAVLFAEIEAFLRELRDEADELDRVLATILFTDIVGSTELAASLGDRRWRELLERHHTVVRALLGRYRGVEQDVAGDGFFASFDGPARAVRCAQAIVEAVRPLQLEIRAGAHTGEVGRADGKASGIAVSIAARVAALARPSEVLVSQTVRDLVAGSGIRFVDRGAHALKGVDGSWQLFATAADR